MRPVACLRLAVATALVLGVLCPPQAQAQARFYWKTLSGANAVPLILESLSGNTNPFDPSHTVVAGANFGGTLALAGYAHTFTLYDRSAMAAVILPMGRVAGDVSLRGESASLSASGFGDPTIEFDFNVIGPHAQKNLPDLLRFEPKFSVDLLADLAVPIGEYDSSTPLNLGQNRWYGRVGAPTIAQLGSWVPGRRTTLEFIPALWLFGTNDDYVGQTMTTDPLFQLDAHLTRDLTERFWASFDGAWYSGGQATVGGVAGEKLNNLGFGLTLGNQINQSVLLTFSYKSTVNDEAPDDLRMDVFSIMVITGWHPLIEGVGRLGGGE
jgi:hypothetical protein